VLDESSGKSEGDEAMKTIQTPVRSHKVVSREEWLKARKALLAKEKELTRQRDELSRQRRELPWVKVEKNYIFDGPKGQETLADLFDRRSQLIIYHFMFGPGWEEGCSGCSFLADHIDGARVHLEHHDVSLVVASRAPLPQLEAFKKRMGWRFKWVSSNGSDFNYDFGVSYKREDLDQGNVFHNFQMQKLSSEEQPGLSVFYRAEAGDIFHTYSTYERGLDLCVGAYNYLDLMPKGRNESSPQDWVRLHDRYGDVDESAPAMSHKEAAVSFLRRAASGRVREAFREHIAPGFRHHNPWFRGDAEALRAAMEENAATSPDKILEVQRVLEQEDLVAIHSRIKQNPADRGGAVVHIFRFEGDRIVELWDIGQACPEDSPNENGMF
jgi:predicted dithiol-disulfide oxidoreductase (DUF899 family)/predicted SnoaL-like aldol condensation-catalyzing enzyme